MAAVKIVFYDWTHDILVETYVLPKDAELESAYKCSFIIYIVV